MATSNSDTFKIRMGQTADFGYAPNKAWPVRETRAGGTMLRVHHMQSLASNNWACRLLKARYLAQDSFMATAFDLANPPGTKWYRPGPIPLALSTQVLPFLLLMRSHQRCRLIRIGGYLSVSGCVHIFNKQAVAHRLAVAARKTVYGETL